MSIWNGESEHAQANWAKHALVLCFVSRQPLHVCLAQQSGLLQRSREANALVVRGRESHGLVSCTCSTVAILAHVLHVSLLYRKARKSFVWLSFCVWLVVTDSSESKEQTNYRTTYNTYKKLIKTHINLLHPIKASSFLPGGCSV